MGKGKPESLSNNEEALGVVKELILHNDEVNSFDFVIDTLIEVCRHDPLQAEQCTLIAHYKGKCGVKSGDFYLLRPEQEEMGRRGLTVSIE